MSGSLPLHSAGPSGQPGLLGSMPAFHKVPTALLWLRRDLRVADNPALVAALQGAVQVVRALHASFGCPCRKHKLHETVCACGSASLRKKVWPALAAACSAASGV